MIYVTETATEYLVSVPINEKERAKGIQGRKWDPERKVWVYPKTKKVLEELIAEFGDANSVINVKIPGSEEKSTPREAIQQADNIQIQSQLEEIKRQVSQLSTITPTKDNNKETLALQLTAMDQQIQSMKQLLDNKEREIEELKRSNASAQEQTTQLRELLTKADKSKKDCSISIKERAKEATSNDTKFCSIIDNNDLNLDLLIDLNNKMYYELKSMLKATDPGLTLYDLILQASDADLLTSEASDYAHLIRKERNKVVHDNAYQKTHDARILMCVFAGALLWLHFP